MKIKHTLLLALSCLSLFSCHPNSVSQIEARQYVVETYGSEVYTTEDPWVFIARCSDGSVWKVEVYCSRYISATATERGYYRAKESGKTMLFPANLPGTELPSEKTN